MYFIKDIKMDIIKKLFTFNDDETSAIGLCKFNDDFFKNEQAKEQIKNRSKKNDNLTHLLKRNF